jgi:hypothetical protein
MTLREEIHTIVYMNISTMLDNPDESGIYQTTKCYNKTTEQIMQAIEARMLTVEELDSLICTESYDGGYSTKQLAESIHAAQERKLKG